MSPNLLRCPFCKGHGEVVYNNHGYDYKSDLYFPLKRATIQCRKCGLRLPRYYSAERAVEVWNARF